jgi:hypothetical protein
MRVCAMLAAMRDAWMALAEHTQSRTPEVARDELYTRQDRRNDDETDQ